MKTLLFLMMTGLLGSNFAEAQPNCRQALRALLSIGAKRSNLSLSQGELNFLQRLDREGWATPADLNWREIQNVPKLIRLGLVREKFVDHQEMIVGSRYQLTWSGFRYMAGKNQNR